MNRLLAFCTTLALLVTTGAGAEDMVISRNGTRPSAIGPEANFTGSVRVDPLYAADEHTGNNGSLVTFEPGARTAWHSHPAGQTLIVTTGSGWVQEDGGAKHLIGPGDVIWTPPGVKHWHGATPTNSLSHIAITNSADGKLAKWMEKLTDDQYAAD